MLRRFRFHLLLLVLTGAVVDGGTLGFRAAWASCGDWLADSGMASHGRSGATFDQLSSELNRQFEQLYLREDERAESATHPVAPRLPLFGCTDPSCTIQPALPASPLPAPVNWDMDRHAYWLQFDTGPEHAGRIHEFSCFVRIPFSLSTDIFRPPKILG